MTFLTPITKANPLKISYILLCCVLILVASNAASANQLTPYEASYTVFRGGSEIGRAEMALERQEENRYQMRFYSEASIFFFSDKREEVSQFDLINGKLVPRHYQFKQDNTFKDKSLNLTFDATNNVISVNKDEQQQWQGELDNQLYRLAAQHAIMAGKKEFELDLINYRGQKKHYAFKVEQEENIKLPYGTVNAIKVETIRQNKKRTTFTWFAPELQYMLVRIQQFKDGEEQGDIRLKSLTSK